MFSVMQSSCLAGKKRKRPLWTTVLTNAVVVSSTSWPSTSFTSSYPSYSNAAAVSACLARTVPVGHTTAVKCHHVGWALSWRGSPSYIIPCQRGGASPASCSLWSTFSTRKTQRFAFDDPVVGTEVDPGFGEQDHDNLLQKMAEEADKQRGNENGGEPNVQSMVDLVKMLHASEKPLWDLVRFEGREASKQSHVSIIHGSVLAHDSLENAVSSDVAHRMATTFLSATELNSLICEMFSEEPVLGLIVAEDLLAHAMRNGSLPDLLTVLLFHKGFTALTTYRLMNWLWRKDRRHLARYLQSVCSEICAADIHPASTIGKGVFMSGGCDVVIGETAVVGDDVCLLQGVTLGGTGNQSGDRHPKVANGCHIGAGSSILGNIPIGEGSRIEAASVVVKPISPYSVNRGVPSKRVAFVVCDPFQDMRGFGVMDPTNHDSGVNPDQKANTVGVKRNRRRMFSEYTSLYIGE